MKAQQGTSIIVKPLAIGIAYALGASLWIVFSDKLLMQVGLSPEALTRWSIAKGIVFVTVTSSLFFLLLQRLQRTNRDLEHTVAARTADLAGSEERFRRVVEGAPDGIFIQTEGVFRYLNPAAIAAFGARGAEELVGTLYAVRVHPDERAESEERIRILHIEGSAVEPTERKYLRLDGSAFEALVTAVPFYYEGSPGAIVFFRDITEDKRSLQLMHVLEQQFRQAQKMEAVGRLAGGIAHDFNNLLMVIGSYTEIIQNGLPLESPMRESTQQVLNASERAAGLTRQLLAFSRKQILAPVVIDLNTIITDTARMLKRLIGEDIELEVNLADDLWKTRSDPDQIVQVLMNLCVNARDAMPHGGVLTIATSNIAAGDESLSRTVPVPSRDFVALLVADTGSGISPEFKEHIFEPFFTTKEVDKGTGLGLSTVYGIVKQSEGYVFVESEVGRGTRFTIYLPGLQEQITAPPELASEQGQRGTETLLVVEDEPALRESICEFMRSLGYDVIEADSGLNGLLAAMEAKRIDVLITDIVMPKMSGRELSQKLSSSRPAMKTIFMSGYTEDQALRQGVSEGASFLQKPFTFSTLARKVREVLKSDSPQSDAPEVEQRKRAQG